MSFSVTKSCDMWVYRGSCLSRQLYACHVRASRKQQVDGRQHYLLPRGLSLAVTHAQLLKAWSVFVLYFIQVAEENMDFESVRIYSGPTSALPGYVYGLVTWLTQSIFLSLFFELYLYPSLSLFSLLSLSLFSLLSLSLSLSPTPSLPPPPSLPPSFPPSLPACLQLELTLQWWLFV